MKTPIRILAALLAVMLLLGAAPVSPAAQGTEWFYLCAVGNGRLIIAPERVYYTQGQSVGQALVASGHSFAGLEDGMVYEIDGVSANFTRSDEDGDFLLTKYASEVTCYCFTDADSSTPSQALQQLIQVMAEYSQEPADVQSAAEDAYARACSQFPGISDEAAASCAVALTNAVENYKELQDGEKYTVTFSSGSGSYAGKAIEAVNPNGKAFSDADGDGRLSLPADTYTFQVVDGYKRISGEITVTEDMTVSAAMPSGDWLLTDQWKLSAAYGEADFLENVFSGSWTDSRSYLATVPDHFTGAVYAYLSYDKELLSVQPQVEAIYTRAGEQTPEQVSQSFGSYRTGAPKALKSGPAGNTIIYRVSVTDAGGYTLSQDYTVTLSRTPTLRALTVADENGVKQAAEEAFSGKNTAYTYKVLTSVSSLCITPQAFGAYADGYAVSVNGQPLEEGAAATVALGGDEEQPQIRVAVSGGGYTTEYVLTVVPGKGRRIIFNTASSDVSMVVVNKNGDVLDYTSYKNLEGYHAYQYTLVPGETYTYLATKETYHHATREFVLQDGANNTITVDVKTDNWLSDLALGETSAVGSKGSFPMEQSFDAASHTYTVVVPDTASALFSWVTSSEQADITARYEQIYHTEAIDGVPAEVTLTSGAARGTALSRVLLASNGHGNTVTYRLSQVDANDGVTYYQDYVVEIIRQLSLENLSVKAAGESVPMFREDGSKGYSFTETDYTLTVPAAETALEITATVHQAAQNYRYGEEGPGYRISVDGEDLTDSGRLTAALSGTQAPETIEIVVTNDYVPDNKTVYTLQVEKAAPVYTAITTTPSDALVALYETVSGNRNWPEDGKYMLSDGYSYAYTLTCSGYVGKQGVIQVTKDEEGNAILLVDGTAVKTQVTGGDTAAQITAALQAAPVNDTLQPELTSQWPSFRGSGTNSGVTEAAFPVRAEEGTLFWANQIGSGYGPEAVGCPILVDGCLITYAADRIYRVDTVNGEIVATGQMDHNSSYAITTPTYYEGMIFIALSNGTVQAFDAVSLESLWVYRDPLGGQPNSPMTVLDGYLYTGFWNSETATANYVCLSVTDEDPAQAKEEKVSVWKHTQKGGFYWAGAYVCRDYLLVGTDDGRSGYLSQSASLLLMDPLSGKILDQWTGLNGDVRSTVSYDETTGAFYFTSKGGSFYTVRVEQDGESWKLTGKRQLALDNGTSSTAMSTSTPVVYNGRAYVGVSGDGQFTAYSGHNITVIDLNSWKIAYSVPTQGYPQTSGLLTTAYEENGFVYVYFFDNYTPGKLRVLQDRKNQTEPTLLTVETFQKTASQTLTFRTPYAVFTPTGDEAEYAICSPIVDEYGVVYFKNDSARLMAFGPNIEKLEVTKLPDKNTYLAGETFDPSGMQVTAAYVNGKTRDVTEYVTWSEEPLAAGETVLTISFRHVMYHNAAGEAGAMDAGIATPTPTVDLPITVSDGSYAKEIRTVTAGADSVTVTFDGVTDAAWQLIAAVYDKDGRQLAVNVQNASGKSTETVPLTIPADAAKVRAFVLTHETKPVMARKEGAVS